MKVVAVGLADFFENKGLSQKEVADMMGTSPAYINAILNNKKDIGKKVAEKMNNLFGLSSSWLLTGEGEMLEAGISQQALGDGNTQVAGNGNHVNSETSRFLEEIAAQRRLTEKALEQYDRLLSVIERMQAGIAGGKP